MKRDTNNNIIFENLSIYELISHDLSHVENFRVFWECLYEQVKISLNNNKEIIVWKYCNYGRIFCYDERKETLDTICVLKENHILLNKIRQDINNGFNAKTNCFGHVWVDGLFWLNPSIELFDLMIQHEDYVEIPMLNPDVDNIIVYFLEGIPVHFCKYNSISKTFLHKIGCRNFEERQEIDVIDIYKYDTIKYLTQLS